jgi:hypothetical protein
MTVLQLSVKKRLQKVKMKMAAMQYAPSWCNPRGFHVISSSLFGVLPVVAFPRMVF